MKQYRQRPSNAPGRRRGGAWVLGSAALLALSGQAEARNPSVGRGPAARHPTPAVREVRPAEAADGDRPENTIDLSLGQARTLSAVGVKNYSVGSPGVADIRLTPSGRKFVVTGRAPGSTSLLLLRKNGTQESLTVNVFQRSMLEVQKELTSLLGGSPGIRIRRVGARYFVEGGVNSEAELHRIETVAALFPGQVVSLALVGGPAADRAINVRVDFFFVQFDSSRASNFGVRYPGSVGGTLSANYDVLAGGWASAEAGVISQVLPSLDVAANRGWAKVLKHSTVITSNGSVATFSNGGEQNFQVSAGLSTSIQQIPFGTTVRVLPRFDPVSHDLQVELDAEVADLTTPVGGLPGRNVSNLETVVTVKEGQAVVLSGIRSSAQQRGSTGLPLLSEIPILGFLFGSQGRSTQNTEGAIFVLPTVMDALDPVGRELLGAALADYNDFDGDLDDVDLLKREAAGRPAPPPSRALQRSRKGRTGGGS